MRSVADHLDHVLALVRPQPVETVDIEAAAGRVLRRAVTARVPVPVFDNSAMDGYGVRFADVREATESAPVVLRVVDDLPAGTSKQPAVGPMEAVRIMTGAPIPSDVDTVVPVEDTDAGTDRVTIKSVKSFGAHVRRAAEDLNVSDEVVPAGVRLGALELSSIASVGVGQVEVSVRPRVAVLATGDELVPPGAPLAHGQIPESNSMLLAHLATALGAEVVHRGQVGDRVDDLRESIASLGSIDLLVLSGGVSVGAYDVVKATLSPRGDIEFIRVAMQPGKPQAFGRLGDGPLVFGLPGNPVSAAVSWETFVRPALEAMQVLKPGPIERVVTAVAWRKPVGRQQMVPVTVASDDQGRLVARPLQSEGPRSHYVGSLGQAHGWVVVPALAERVDVGDVLEFRRR